ncbi:MAG: DNRLRE domain-containing protein [Promethearchaeota archaeon]
MLQVLHQLFRKSSTFSSIFIFTLIIQTYGYFWVVGSPTQWQRVAEIIAEADAYVDSTAPSTNHGLDDGLQIWRTNTSEQWIILRFNLPEIPTDSFYSIELQLQTGTVLSSYFIGVFGCNNTNWDETEVTFNNFPTHDSQVLGGSWRGVFASFHNYTWLVDRWVREKFELGVEQVSFVLKATDYEAGGELLSFISKEGAQNGLGSPPLLILSILERTTSSYLADDPNTSLIILFCITGGGFFFIIFLFLRRSPSPPSSVLSKKSSKPPLSVEARNDIIFTPLAKKLFETAIEKPVKPVEPKLIDLDSEIVPTPKERRSFFCQIDGQKHPATDSAYECEECSRNVCGNCYESSKAVGISSCPFCQGRLIRIQ